MRRHLGLILVVCTSAFGCSGEDPANEVASSGGGSSGSSGSGSGGAAGVGAGGSMGGTGGAAGAGMGGSAGAGTGGLAGSGGAAGSSGTGGNPSCDVYAGPDGTHWPPGTPAYTTPATVTINSLAELNAALKSASAGDVIEVAPSTLSSQLEVTGGSASWKQNVLIRPPLGQRGSVKIAAELRIISPNVTFAGLSINSFVSLRAGGDHAFLARCELSANGGLIANDTHDSGFYELVATQPKTGGDRAQVKGSNGNTTTGFTLSGVWLKGAYRPVGSADHSDTLQLVGVSGGSVKSVTIEDSVLWPSSNAALQNAADGTIMKSSWFASCGGFSSDVPSGNECGGFHAMNGGTNNEVYGCVVNGTLNGGDPYAVVNDTKLRKFAQPPLSQSNNVVDPNLKEPAPELCDLDAIWDK
ncbi:hypothetical protein KDK88_03955 [bacterium]|nr:hypothetical protein [bacterium]